MKAVLYRGTGCDPAFVKNAEIHLREFGFTTIKNVCWTRSFNPVDYGNVKKYNVQKGKWDIAIGHSAGGFPLPLTSAKYRIAINPFIAVYPLVNVVFHAKDDWLTIPDNPPVGNIELYDGGHSTFPRRLLVDKLIALYGRPNTEPNKKGVK